MLWTNSRSATLRVMTVTLLLTHPWEATEKPIHLVDAGKTCQPRARPSLRHSTGDDCSFYPFVLEPPSVNNNCRLQRCPEPPASEGSTEERPAQAPGSTAVLRGLSTSGNSRPKAPLRHLWPTGDKTCSSVQTAVVSAVRSWRAPGCDLAVPAGRGAAQRREHTVLGGSTADSATGHADTTQRERPVSTSVTASLHSSLQPFDPKSASREVARGLRRQATPATQRPTTRSPLEQRHE